MKTVKQPTGAELLEMLAVLHWSVRAFSEELGEFSKICEEYTRDQRPIPPKVFAWVKKLADQLRATPHPEGYPRVEFTPREDKPTKYYQRAVVKKRVGRPVAKTAAQRHIEAEENRRRILEIVEQLQRENKKMATKDIGALVGLSGSYVRKVLAAHATPG